MIFQIYLGDLPRGNICVDFRPPILGETLQDYLRRIFLQAGYRNDDDNAPNPWVKIRWEKCDDHYKISADFGKTCRYRCQVRVLKKSPLTLGRTNFPRIYFTLSEDLSTVRPASRRDFFEKYPLVL